MKLVNESVWLRSREAHGSYQSLTFFTGRNPRKLNDREVRKPRALQEQFHSTPELNNSKKNGEVT